MSTYSKTQMRFGAPEYRSGRLPSYAGAGPTRPYLSPLVTVVVAVVIVGVVVAAAAAAARVVGVAGVVGAVVAGGSAMTVPGGVGTKLGSGTLISSRSLLVLRFGSCHRYCRVLGDGVSGRRGGLRGGG